MKAGVKPPAAEMAGDAAKLLAKGAEELVRSIRERTGIILLEEKSELRIRIAQILNDSDAPELRKIETDMLPLAPWAWKEGERGRKLSLYEALIDCRMHLTCGPHLSRSDEWNCGWNGGM